MVVEPGVAVEVALAVGRVLRLLDDPAAGGMILRKWNE